MDYQILEYTGINDEVLILSSKEYVESFFKTNQRDLNLPNLNNLEYYFELFESIHNRLVMELPNLFNDNLIRKYFHLRHDIFGIIIMYYITGHFVYDFDVSFSEYNIESNKTPDYIYTYGGQMFIIEFTVCSHVSLIDYHKGYVVNEVKYTKEANLLNAEVLIIGLALKVDNIYSILEKVKIFLPDLENISESLHRFRNICCMDLDLINSSYIEHADLPYELKLSDIEEISGNYTYKVMKKIYVKPDVYVAVKRQFSAFLDKISLFTKGKMFNYKLSKYNKIIIYGSKHNREEYLDKIQQDEDYFYSNFDINDRRIFGESGIEVNCYSKYSLLHVNSNVPQNYFEELLNLDYENQIGYSYIENNALTEEKMHVDFANIDRGYIQVNDIEHKFKCKRSFRAPLVDTSYLIPADYENLRDTAAMFSENINDELLSTILKTCSIQFRTKYVVKNEYIDKFSKVNSELNDKRLLRQEYLKDVNKRLFGDNRQEWCNRYQQLKDKMSESEINEFEKLNEDYINCQKGYERVKKQYCDELKDTAVKINLGRKNLRTHLGKLLDISYSHFRKKQHSYAGWGNYHLNLSTYQRDLESFYVNELNETDGIPISINLDVCTDLPNLSQLKKMYIDDNRVLNILIKSKISANLEFIQRWAKSLYTISGRTDDSNKFHLDNLGYKNCILIVRGGKSSIITGMSKDYILIYPVSDNILKIDLPVPMESDYKFININGVKYMVSPWMKLNIDLINFYMTVGYNVLTHIILLANRTMCDLNLEPYTALKIYMMSYYLALNSTRKLENLLHNMRYLLFGTLSSHADYKGLMPDLLYFNSNAFDKFIQSIILKNMPILYKQMAIFRNKHTLHETLNLGNIVNFFTGYKIKDLTHFTEFFYLSFNMRKGYYNKALEQSKNLTNVLQDLDSFYNNERSELEYAVDITKCSESDFCFDPVLSEYLGIILSEYFYTNFGRLHVISSWEKVLNKQLDTMANNKGLRGDGYNKDFFNHKGYEVVYNRLDKVRRLRKIDNITDSSYTFLDAYNDLDIKFSPKLHMVEKEQRGGNREIFVLDYNTKVTQQMIENMFKALCKDLPNEFISVPSDQRMRLIHSRFHEYESKNPENYNFVLNGSLDCRKWAPHCNTRKYIYFVHGMKSVLPKTFVDFLYTFFKEYESKKIYTREYVVNTIKNNEKYKHLIKYLIKDVTASEDAYYFKMPFSFCMGIFNYLSSLMHAACQILSSNIIAKLSIIKYDDRALLMGVAHSDDSLIRIYNDKAENLPHYVRIHEVILKGANHLLSVKKCFYNIYNIKDRLGSNYLELLSILYIKGELLSMLPKFTSNIEYIPTNKGYTADCGYIFMKVNELINFGATFSEAYIFEKIISSAIRYFYKLPKKYLDYPYWLFGSVDSHPLLIMMMGGDAELVRYMIADKNKFKLLENVLSVTSMNIGYDINGMSLQWKYPIVMPRRLRRYLKDKDVLPKEIEWIYSNVKSRKSLNNIDWYDTKLRNPDFFLSIGNEPEIFRLLRAFRGLNTPLIYTKNGALKIQNLMVLIEAMEENCEMKDVNVVSDMLKLINADQISFYKNLNDVFVSYKITSNMISTKPVFVRLRDDMFKIDVECDAGQAVVALRHKQHYDLLGIDRDITRSAEFMSKVLEANNINVSNLNDDQLVYVFNKLLTKTDKYRHLYSMVPSGFRNIESNNDLAEWVANTSLYKKKLSLISHDMNVMKRKHLTNYGEDEELISCLLSAIYLKSRDMLSDDVKFFYNETSYTYKEIRTLFARYPHLNLNVLETELANLQRYIVWEKEQKKIGTIYKGEGIFIIRIDNFYGRVVYNEYGKYEIYTNRENQDMYFDSSMKEFIYFNFVISQFDKSVVRPASMYLHHNYVLGQEEKTGRYKIGYAKDMILVFGKVIYNDMDYKIYDKEYLRINSFKTFFTDKSNKKVSLPAECYIAKRMILTRYIDYNSLPVILKPKYMNVIAEVERGATLCMKEELMLTMFNATFLYNIISSGVHLCYQEEHPLLMSTLEWGNLNPDSGILTVNEAMSLMREAGEINLALPTDIKKLRCIEADNYDFNSRFNDCMKEYLHEGDIKVFSRLLKINEESVNSIKSEIVLRSKLSHHYYLFAQPEMWSNELLRPILESFFQDLTIIMVNFLIEYSSRVSLSRREQLFMNNIKYIMGSLIITLFSVEMFKYTDNMKLEVYENIFKKIGLDVYSTYLENTSILGVPIEYLNSNHMKLLSNYFCILKNKKSYTKYEKLYTDMRNGNTEFQKLIQHFSVMPMLLNIMKRTDITEIDLNENVIFVDDVEINKIILTTNFELETEDKYAYFDPVVMRQTGKLKFEDEEEAEEEFEDGTFCIQMHDEDEIVPNEFDPDKYINGKIFRLPVVIKYGSLGTIDIKKIGLEYKYYGIISFSPSYHEILDEDFQDEDHEWGKGNLRVLRYMQRTRNNYFSATECYLYLDVPDEIFDQFKTHGFMQVSFMTENLPKLECYDLKNLNELLEYCRKAVELSQSLTEEVINMKDKKYIKKVYEDNKMYELVQTKKNEMLANLMKKKRPSETELEVIDIEGQKQSKTDETDYDRILNPESIAMALESVLNTDTLAKYINDSYIKEEEVKATMVYSDKQSIVTNNRLIAELNTISMGLADSIYTGNLKFNKVNKSTINNMNETLKCMKNSVKGNQKNSIMAFNLFCDYILRESIDIEYMDEHSTNIINFMSKLLYKAANVNSRDDINITDALPVFEGDYDIFI